MRTEASAENGNPADTAQQKVLRRLKDESLSRFLKDLNDHEVEHTKNMHRVKVENDNRRREKKGEEVGAGLGNSSEELVQLIDRLLGEYQS